MNDNQTVYRGIEPVFGVIQYMEDTDWVDNFINSEITRTLRTSMWNNKLVYFTETGIPFTDMIIASKQYDTFLRSYYSIILVFFERVVGFAIARDNSKTDEGFNLKFITKETYKNKQNLIKVIQNAFLTNKQDKRKYDYYFGFLKYKFLSKGRLPKPPKIISETHIEKFCDILIKQCEDENFNTIYSIWKGNSLVSGKQFDWYKNYDNFADCFNDPI
jgi:hypothetical protein